MLGATLLTCACKTNCIKKKKVNCVIIFFTDGYFKWVYELILIFQLCNAGFFIKQRTTAFKNIIMRSGNLYLRKRLFRYLPFLPYRVIFNNVNGLYCIMKPVKKHLSTLSSFIRIKIEQHKPVGSPWKI